MNLDVRDRWLVRAQDRVAGAGLRAGAARSAVIDLLAREGQCLLTVAELTEMLRTQPVGSAASVYLRGRRRSGVVAVRNGLVAAIRAVDVPVVVGVAVVLGRARGGVRGVDRDHVLVSGMRHVRMVAADLRLARNCE